MNTLNDFIKIGWEKARKTADDKDLKLPYPFVPPCIKGDFRTLYYWDTYFTNLGLIADGHTEWARENVDNLLYAFDEELLIKYYDYISTRVQISEKIFLREKLNVARNFIAEAESGEDYTPRYANHNALEYVQIDLNAHLYGVEDFLSKYFENKITEKSLFYKKQKQRRLALIEKILFQ